MLLRYILLGLNFDEYPRDLDSSLQFRARYVCNYVERRLRALKFHAEGFGRICIDGRKKPRDACPIVPENAAVADVFFDLDRYERLGPGEHHEFFIDMLCEGLKLCSKYRRIPLDHFMESIDEFRRGGYRNEWVHRRRLLRKAGLRASLLCRMDTNKFVLTLRLEQKGTTVFNKEILKTKPDELIFAYQFKDVKLDGNVIVVLDRFGDQTYKLELSTLRSE